MVILEPEIGVTLQWDGSGRHATPLPPHSAGGELRKRPGLCSWKDQPWYVFAAVPIHCLGCLGPVS